MRRHEQEITNKAEVLSIIEKCNVCRLALADEGIPYIVPMNFGYEYAGEKLTLYFHGAGEGKKLDIISKNPMACFEMDCGRRLVPADEACDYSMEYESVVGSGKIKLCIQRDEKIHALKLLMKQYAKDGEFSFPDHALESTTVFKLEASEFTGKHLKG